MRVQAFIAPLALSLLTTTAAYAQSECETYVVRAGDTIRGIAFNAYGEEELYESLFKANQQALEGNAPAFAAGTEITVPCYDDLDFAVLGSGIGRLSVASAEVDITLPEIEPEIEVASPEVEQPTIIGPNLSEPEVLEPAVVQASDALIEIRLVTSSNFEPFSDVAAGNGGLFTELMTTAVDRSGVEEGFAISFEDDWSEHLDQMLPAGEYDVSFPWYRPNCELGSKLSAEMQTRCADFVWSEPYYETVVGMYTRADSTLETARTSFDLFGTRVCRPAQYFTFDLEEADLVSPNVTFMQPETAADCFKALIEDRVDVVTLNVSIAEEAISQMGADALIVEMEEMATIQTLHAIALRSNAEAIRYLDDINTGMREMSTSGEWISIVSRHLDNAG